MPVSAIQAPNDAMLFVPMKQSPKALSLLGVCLIAGVVATVALMLSSLGPLRSVARFSPPASRGIASGAHTHLSEGEALLHTHFTPRLVGRPTPGGRVTTTTQAAGAPPPRLLSLLPAGCTALGAVLLTTGLGWAATRLTRRPPPPEATPTPTALAADPALPDRAAASVGRRAALGTAAGLALLPQRPRKAAANPMPRVLVAGATGATGRLTVQALQAAGVAVVAGARSPSKAAGLGVPVVPLDVTGPFEGLVASLQGVDVVVSCIGFVPANPFEMGKAAHAVDNVGTVALVDAAKAAGVRRFVLMSSILTNGRAIGQARSPGFVITNAFGGVLDEKLLAERHLRQSALDWAIVRPGGLENRMGSGVLALSPEDTLFSGTVDRALVAQVLAAAALAPRPALNQVVEVVELGSCAPNTCPATLAPAPADPRDWFP